MGPHPSILKGFGQPDGQLILFKGCLQEFPGYPSRSGGIPPNQPLDLYGSTGNRSGKELEFIKQHLRSLGMQSIVPLNFHHGGKLVGMDSNEMRITKELSVENMTWNFI
jgi:hypothetical protein